MLESRFFSRIKSLFRRGREENDLSDELQAHLQNEIAKNIATGMTPKEARYAALRSFGGLDQIKEQCRDLRGVRFMEELWQDLRYGLRMLCKSPGFAAAAVLSLALGIGANSAIFSITNATLLRLRPYPKNPDRMYWMLVMDFTKASFGDPASLTNYLFWREQNQVFEQLAAYREGSFNLTDKEKPEHLGGLYVSANFFSAVGAQAALGRTFLPEENHPGNERVVVISDRLWKRLGASPNLIGKALRLNGETYTIIGPSNFPRTFHLVGSDSELWVPLTYGGKSLGEMVVMVALLKPGITLERARSNMETITSGLLDRSPENTNRAVETPDAEARKSIYSSDRKIPPSALKNGWIIDFFSLSQPVDSYSVNALILLQGAVAFVLLLACGNVANLLLARGAARQKEIATRVALGATRLRLVRQFLAEGFLLSVLGGGLGLFLAVWGFNVLMRFLPRDIPALFYVYDGITLDVRVLGFTGMTTCFAAVVFGLVPALRASEPDLQEVLKEGVRGSTENLGLRRGRSWLVVTAIATALVLLIGAGLMVKSFLQLRGPYADLEPENLLSMSLALDASKYKSWHQVRSFWDELQQGISGLPKAQSIGFNANKRTNKPWLNGVGVSVDGHLPLNSTREATQCDIVTPDYLKTMRIPLWRGRYFSEDDSRGVPVAIISERLARRFFPTNEDPIGKQIRITSVEKDEEIDEGTRANTKNIGYSIVGVVRDLRRTGQAENDTRRILYILNSQSPAALTAAMRRITIRVRTHSAPLGLAGAVRNAVAAIDKDQPVFPPTTLDQADSRSLAPERLLTTMFGMFAIVATGLASLGIYGVMAYSVTRRTHEMAIRTALGAHVSDVIWLVLRQGLQLITVGLAIGLVAAFNLSRVLSGYIFGVSPTDPSTYLSVSLLLAATALAACYIPARRATRVDPMTALRCE